MISKKIYFIFIVCLTTNLFGQMESEFNNTPETANSIYFDDLTGTLSGSVFPTGDKDYFKLTIPRAGVFDLVLTSLADGLDGEIKIYNSSEILLYEKYASGGDPVFMKSLVCEAGDYYLMVHDRGDNESNTDLYSFSVTLDTSDVYECNNTFETATSVSLYSTLSGQINGKGDKDFFKVYVPQPGVFDLSLTSLVAPVDGEIVIYDADEILIDDRYASNGSPVFMQEQICEEGYYYLMIHDRGDNEFDSDLYNFTIGFDTLDIYECNNTFATAYPLEINSTLEAQVYPVGDKDFFKVTVPRAGVFDISLTSLEADIDGEIVIYDSYEDLIAWKYQSDGSPVFKQKLVCDPGDYYILIHDKSDNNANSDLYNLNITLDTADVYECNNTFATAYPMNFDTIIHGQINDKADHDIFKVYVPRPGVMDIGLTSLEDDIDGQIVIYDSYESMISYKYKNHANPVFHRQLVCDTGFYYVLIQDKGDNEFSSDLYSLELQLDTSDIYECNNTLETAYPVNLNTTINAQINSVGDQDFFKVHLSTPGKFDLYLSGLEDGLDGKVKILDGMGVLLDYAVDYFGSDPVGLTYTSCDTGYYYLVVSDYGDNESSRTLYNFDIGFDTLGYSTSLVSTCTPYVSPGGNYIWTEAGTYTDTLYGAGVCGDSVITVILSTPEINTGVSVDGTMLSAEEEGMLYQWLDCNDDFSPIPGAESQDYEAEISGEYAVQIKDLESNCTDTSACITMDFSRVNPLEERDFVSCYPNPVKNQLTVELSEICESSCMEIKNLMGQPVFFMQLSQEKNLADLSELPKGTYILEIRSENKRLYYQLIERL